MPPLKSLLALLIPAALASPGAGAAPLAAQRDAVATPVVGVPATPDTAVYERPELPEPAPPAATAAAAGTLPDRIRRAAWRDPGSRIVISVDERRLLWLDGADTLLSAPVAVGKATRLTYGDRVWEFVTPPGVRRVQSKVEDPVWVPPDWHYVELARDSAWTLVYLRPGPGVRLADGTRVVVRGDRVGRIRSDGELELVAPDEEVIFGDTLFVPPINTLNRQVRGELGAYALPIGDGYMIHGTPDKESIGQAATHGCIRLDDDAIARLHAAVPVGTKVYIY